MAARLLRALSGRSEREACSLVHVESLLFGGFGDDPLVCSEDRPWLLEHVLLSRHKLAFVVGADSNNTAVRRETFFIQQSLPSVANHDLGRVFVGHDHSGTGESAAVGQWVVSLKWLVDHASVQVGSNLVDIPGHSKNKQAR